MPLGYSMMASCQPAMMGSSSATLMSPNESAQNIEEAGVEASRGGASRRNFGSGGDGGSGCAEHESVSCMLRRNHGMTGIIQGLSDSTCSSSFVAHAPLHSQTSIVNFDQAAVPDSVDPLSYFLMSWRKDHDPFDLGIGSVADGTFAGRQPTCEQLLLFRSHRLMQAEAVSIAMNKTYSSSASEKERLGLIGKTVARKAWEKLLEKTVSTMKRIRALRRDGIFHTGKQQEVIDEERKICNRMIAAVFDKATCILKEISDSDRIVSSGSGCSRGSDYGSTSSGFGNISGNNNYYSIAAMEPGSGSESGNRLAFSPPTLESSSPFEYHQLGTNPAWEGEANTSCVTMAPLPPTAPPITMPEPPQRQSVTRQHHLITPQQLPIRHSPGGIVGSSNVFALTKMGDRLHHHAPLGGFHGGLSNPMSHSVDESQLAARTSRLTEPFQGKQTNKKSPMVTKMSAMTPVGLRSAHSNRKGSRHRLTPQAKDILEGWLAKHWLNPYPTEEEKFCLAQACKITVPQVNNWMMNVRVRRCRTKKIGVATGPAQITFANVPKAIMPQGMVAAEAEHLLADRTTFMGTKGVTSTAIVGGSKGVHQKNVVGQPKGWQLTW